MSNVQKKDDAAGSDSSVLADLIDGLTVKMQAGERIDWEDVARQYPEHAGELLRLGPALGALGNLSKSGPRAFSGLAAPAVAEDSLAAGVLGDFRIVREVGRGAMGVVYEAEQVSLGRRVALKVLPFAATMDARALQRFQNEARAAACLHHTNVVPVYYVGCERGIHFYAMQFIDGQTLADLIRELRPPAERIADATADTEPAARQSTQTTKSAARGREFFRRAAEWGVQAPEALDHAHQAAIVHRDVKPGNLLLDGRGQLWVADFGLAHVRQGEAGLTMTGDLVGTLRYMSPEQALAKRVPIDHRTDVYSLGATLYELLTLRPALTGKDRQELLRQIAFEEPTPPRRLNKAIPQELQIIVLKAMEKNPADRYATAQEMADDLRRFLDDKPIRARRPSWRLVTARWARRHRPIVWAASVVLLLAAVLGGVNLWWLEQRQAETERVVGEHLQRAGVFQEEERWEEARQELGLAEERLAGGGPAVLAERLRTLRMDVAAVTDLDQALQFAAGRSVGMDYASADEAFTAAFRRRGLDLASMSPEEIADRIRRSAVRARLVAALDVWAVVKENLAHSGGEQVLVVARLADDDPWRQRLRDPAVRENGAVLENLALEEGVLAQPSISLFLMSKMLDEAGRPAAAESLLRRAQQRYPAEFWIHQSLGDLLREFGPVSERSVRLAESVGCSRAALALRPRSAGTHYNLGFVLYEQKRLEDAKVEFRRAIELDPGLAGPSLIGLGIVLREQGNLEEAGANFRKAIALKTDDVDALSNLGLVLEEQGRLEEAEAELRKAVALKLNYVAHKHLGDVLRKQGKPEEAEAEYRKAVAIKPGDSGSHSDLGSFLGEQGRLKEAEAEFRKAISLVPNGANVHWTLANRMSLESNGADVHWNLGTALIRLGNLDEAEAEIRKGIALKPDQASAHAVLATSVLIGLGKLVQAEAEYRKAIALQPDDAAAHMDLGNLLRDLGKLDEAEAEVREAVALQPDYAAAHMNLGNVLRAKQQLDEAIQEYRRAIELDPKNVQAHNNLGNALKDKQQWDEAIQECRLAIQLDPKLAVPHNNLGIALEGKRQLDEAIQEYRRAIELDPKYALAHNNLGVALYEKQQLDEAIQEYRRAIDFDPKYAEPHNNLGFALRETGKLTESLDAFRRGHRLGSGQPGWTYPSAQWVQEAESLVELDPKLAAILEAKKKPADDAERLALARLCQQPFKKLYATAARFYGEAFAAEPALAEKLGAEGGRYDAACAAALAGCGQGKDAGGLGEKERTGLRAQALKWLRADLKAWRRLLETGPGRNRPAIAQQLQHWLEDSDLAGIRGEKALLALPEAERPDWQKLWQDVEALRLKAASPPDKATPAASKQIPSG